MVRRMKKVSNKVNDHKLQLNIEIKGNTEDDLVLALKEVMKKVSEGYKAGFDSNESGKYSFVIE